MDNDPYGEIPLKQLGRYSAGAGLILQHRPASGSEELTLMSPDNSQLAREQTRLAGAGPTGV